MLFSADAKMFKKKKKIALENIKKMLWKVAHNRPNFFFQYWPGCPNGPQTEIPYHQKPYNAELGIHTGNMKKKVIRIATNKKLVEHLGGRYSDWVNIVSVWPKACMVKHFRVDLFS